MTHFVVHAALAMLLLGCASGPQTPQAPHSEGATRHVEGVQVSEQAPPAGEPVTAIRVEGMQWAWWFHHASHRVSGTLQAPLGRWVHLTFASADVAHRFEVPELGLSVDIAPGETVERWVRVEHAAEFRTVCSVSCPERGYEFVAELQFIPEADYEAVLASAGRPEGYSDTRWGELLWQRSGCTACHAPQEPSPIAPPLTRIWGGTRTLGDGSRLATEGEEGLRYLRESITAPGAQVVVGFNPIMPVYDLPEVQVEALVAYVRCGAPDGCEQLPECAGLELCRGH